MTLDLYGTLASAPCRSVLLTAKAIGVTLNIVETVPLSEAIKSPEFIKKNPQSTIPTLDDNGLYLNESRAIMQYLCNQYSHKTDKYYPKTPKVRALIDCRLNFDMGALYSRFLEAYFPVIFFGQKFSPEKIKRVDQALEYLEVYVSSSGFVAGNELTIADFAVVSSLSTMEGFGHDFVKFPKVREYLEKCKRDVPGYMEINQKGVDIFVSRFGAKVKEARQDS